jgi:thioredoxin-related protein
MKKSTFTVFTGILLLIHTTACSQDKKHEQEITATRESAINTQNTIDFPELVSVEDILSKAKKENKNCLIYFSAYSSVNARKLEDQLLNKPEIKQFIRENFVCTVAYVDDNQKERGQTETKGERYASIQKEYFNSIGQPFIYVLSPDKEIVLIWSYAEGIDSLKDWLKERRKD